MLQKISGTYFFLHKPVSSDDFVFQPFSSGSIAKCKSQVFAELLENSNRHTVRCECYCF